MKKYILVNISHLYGFKGEDLATLQSVSEYVWDRSIGQFYDYVDVEQEYIDVAIEYLKTKTGLTTADLKPYQDEIEDNIKRALNDAYETNYADEWVAAWYRKLREKIIEYYGVDGTKLQFITADRKTVFDMPETLAQAWTDTDVDTIAITATRQQMINYLVKNYGDKAYHWYSSLAELKAMKWQELADIMADALDDNADITPIAIDDVDFYNQMGSVDNWLESFKNEEEISYDIVERIKNHGKKVKAYITNDVPLNKRLASIKKGN